MYIKNIYCALIRKDIYGLCVILLFNFYLGKISHDYYPNFNFSICSRL
jgi:hypothetical protein